MKDPGRFVQGFIGGGDAGPFKSTTLCKYKNAPTFAFAGASKIKL